MGKKLLSVFFLLSIFFLSSFSGFGQECPTSVSISANPGSTICAGTEVTFTANTNGGSGNFTYQWKIDGVNAGTNSNQFSTSGLENGDKVTVTITAADTNPCTISSSSYTMTVNAVRTPTVSITTNKNSLCSGETITFNASNTYGGTSPQYAWYINSSSTIAKTGASATFSASDFTEGNNTVHVILTSDINCASSTTSEPASATFVLKSDATINTPSNKDQALCISTSLQAISFALGGGATNATVTGLPPGITGSKSGNNFVLSGSPTTTGTFSYTVTTTGTCAQATATGTITVNPNATIALTSGNNTQTVCAAGGVSDGNISPITYSIGETGTGALASGLPSGITGSYSNGVFTIQGSSSAVGTHSYSVKATGTCGESGSLTGTIVITGNKAPSVSITSSDADNTVCAGTSVKFTATPTNGGSNPKYQWKIDGANAGTDSSTFTTTVLTNGQTVTVEMSSSETCLTTASVTSNSITTAVNPNLTPEVTIEASDSDICPGDSVTFTATPVNGGASPTYQWKIGNTNTGTNSPTFTTSSLTDGQVVSVIMTSSETCLASATATSNSIETNVNPDLIPSVTIISNDSNNIICSGSNISFTATPVNGGGTPSYQWKVGTSNVGTDSPTYSSTSLTNGQVVTVVMTASDDICLGQTTSATSNPIPVQVDNSIASETPQWDNSNAAHNPTAICPSVSGLKYKVAPISGATSYDWTLPSGWTITNGAGTNEITVTANVNASAGSVRVKGKTECGQSLETSTAVTTGTAAHVGAGPDQTVCPGTTQITLAGEIGGVITQHRDWDWFASVNGGSFTSTGFSNGGNSLDGIYSIPTSVQNGGTVTIRIQSVKPAGNCDIKTDEMTITIQSAASISDPATKNQTVCLNSDLTPISFNVGGAGQGATTSGLPAGITGSFADGIYTLSGTPTVAGTFNYTITTTGDCTNATRSGTITVNPRPTFTQPQEVGVCAGSTTSTISFGGSSVTGTTYNWTNDNTSIGLATSGTGNITSFTASNSTNEPLVANISVTPIANNCEGTAQQFQITVYPTATFTVPTDLKVCNGENLQDIIFAGSNVTGTTYKWKNSNTNIGLASEGTGNISSFSGNNTTNSPIESTITVTPVANGCDGTPEEFTITVNPTPAFTAPESIVVCNGEVLSQVDFSQGNVTGTTFSWTNDNTSIGLAASGAGSLPSFTAINNENEPVNATITIIPVANECEGEPVTFKITVNPTTTVNTIEDVIICNGEDQSELVLSSTVSGTSYSWTNSLPTIGLAGSGTGNIPAFLSENTTDQPVTATITVTPTANECEGTPLEFTITVNPNPTVNVGPDQTICSNGVATMAATLGGGASDGVWTTNGSGTFSNNSTNAQYTPSDSDALNGSVILTYTSNDPEGPCGSISDTIELFINNEVLITTQPENIGVCSTEPSELTVIASGDNLSYEWRRTDGVNIVNSNGIYSSTLSFNNTTSTNAGEYYVVVRGEDTCDEVESERVTINVDENIVIEEPVTEVPICGDGFSEVTMKFIAHANGSPLTFTWFKDNVEIDANSDTNITITTGSPDSEGRYTGTLHLANITTAYNGDYYVEIKGPAEFTCSTAVTNPFQLRLNEMPALPVVEDLIVCQNETPNAFTVTTGTNLKWYVNENDAEFIVNEAGQPTAPVPSTDVPGDFYYWVTQQPAACESEKVQVKVTVKEKPAIPTLTSEEALVEYCLGETAVPLTATATTGSTLNWYLSETGEASTTAPTPNTESPGETTYWVSQTPNDGFGCESARALITVNVYALPEITASVEKEVMCLGSPAELSATGGVSYIWYDGEEVIGNEASISHIPTVAKNYEFSVVVTDSNGCENTATVKVQVDENTVPGILTGPESVCVSSPTGTLTLAGYTGTIVRWEKTTDGTTWSNIAETTSSHSFTNLSASTSFRAIVKNGVCEELASNEITVSIDPLAVGGDLLFANVGRVFTICQNAVGDYAEPLNLIGRTGEVIAWKYRSFDATSWTTLMVGGEPFTGTTLTADQIESLNFQKTTVFQVEVRSGVCAPDALSETAILSVIPSDITPTPVTVDPGVVCLGEQVKLNSETGYQTGTSMLDEGAFDNASITSHGWRIRRQNNTTDLGFDTDANNTEFDRWKRATPRAFTTAALTSPYTTSGVTFDSGAEDNKGFALVSGNYSSTMETKVFSMGSTDQALLTFDQAYNLTPGASIKVEISRDGGATYETIYVRSVQSDATTGIKSGNFGSFGSGTVDSTPENKIEIDLGRYLGQSNLRIRFNYTGKRPGDIWAVDNIDVPEGPGGVTMEWRDYTNPNVPEGIFIGTNNSETYIPTKIGLNVFEVKTKLVYNSKGDVCEVAENAQRIEVFVFDKYTTTASANQGSCGNNTAQLSATVTNATGNTFTTFPTPDGYIGEWKIESSTGYSLIDSNPDDGIAAINDPNAILSANEVGTFKASFILKPTTKNANGVLYENKNCKPTAATHDIVFQPCTTLDFDGVDDFVDLGEGYTGDYSIEAWIRPFERTRADNSKTDPTKGTIISTPQLEINMTDLSGLVTPNGRWYHVAVDSDGKLYVDGIDANKTIAAKGTTNRAFIGARWNAPNPENYFSGWIEEVRIWNGKISEKNIRFTMNQRLKADGNIGVVVDMAHPDAPAFGSLAGYYQLIATNILNGGYTLDLAANAVNGKLRNMTTTQENTAPLPFYTGSDGSWDTAATWARPTVWYIPNTSGITWNIVRTSHNVNANRDISVLGLVSEVNTLTMEGTNPIGWQSGAGGSGKPLTISHYLRLDGGIDLAGESQLLQPELSIVDLRSSGWLERDQQGTASSYNYNYWSSPVSSAPENVPYTIGGAMKDGSNPANLVPANLDFGDPYAYADGALGNPPRISRYWLNLFHGSENVYAEWHRIAETTAIPVGEGYTMKGTSGNADIPDAQNYTFRGIPNNGDVNLSISAEQSYLIGNPYPSAIDADQFIRDNLSGVTGGNNSGINSFNGTLYFWSHFGGKTHMLKKYEGGYAVYNLSGGIIAINTDERILNSNNEGGSEPQQFIPVGQSFFINSTSVAEYSQSTSEDNPPTIHGGPVKFKNSQRVFMEEEDSHSVFHKPEIVVKGNKEVKDHTDKRTKFWLKFKSPKGYHREILVAADENTTDGFDLGYDAPMIEYNIEDMFWLIGATELVIQGVPDFDKARVIPMGLVIDGTKTFTIEIAKSINVPEGMEIYLKDKVTDSIHDLRNTPYVSSSEPGYINERFELVFFKDAPDLEPNPGNPGEEIDYGIDLSFRHAHVGRELQILNPKQVPINELLLFDMNGKLITTYKNIAHEKEVRLPVKNYSAGVYVAKLYSENTVITKKIIIQN